MVDGFLVCNKPKHVTDTHIMPLLFEHTADNTPSNCSCTLQNNFIMSSACQFFMDKNVLADYPILKKLNSVYSTYNPFKHYSPHLCLYSRWLPYQNSAHIYFFFPTSKLRVYKIHLSDDDYPKNTKKWKHKSQSSSLCNSLQWLFNSLSSKYFHYHFI